MSKSMRIGTAVGAAAVLAAGAVIWAQPAEKGSPTGMRMRGMGKDHVMLTPGELKWTDGPASLPPGAKMAVLEGEPASEGPLTFRLKIPAGYKIAAHHHPQIEHVTVISGTLNMGTGDKLDTSKGTALPPGSFAVMQIGTRHFAWADEETVVQIHGIGPWGITYVDPATDPRNKK